MRVAIGLKASAPRYEARLRELGYVQPAQAGFVGRDRPFTGLIVFRMRRPPVHALGA